MFDWIKNHGCDRVWFLSKRCSISYKLHVGVCFGIGVHFCTSLQLPHYLCYFPVRFYEKIMYMCTSSKLKSNQLSGAADPIWVHCRESNWGLAQPGSQINKLYTLQSNQIPCRVKHRSLRWSLDYFVSFLAITGNLVGQHTYFFPAWVNAHLFLSLKLLEHNYKIIPHRLVQYVSGGTYPDSRVLSGLLAW